MRIYTLTITAMLYLFSLGAIAGPGHDHDHAAHPHPDVTQAQAEAAAIKNLTRLADKGKIDKSWVTIKPTTIEKKELNGKSEWVAVFNNNTVTDPTKQTLYIFLSSGGEYIAANHSGK